MKEGEHLHSSHIADSVFNAFLSYTAITLNSVTIHALQKTSSLPKSLKTLLLSLAVSDLGVGLIVQPLYIVRHVMELKHNTENNPNYSATFTAFITTANLLSFASFFGVTALSADRFLAVHLHLRYQELVTHKRVAAAVILIWVFSATLSFIRLWIPRDISFSIFSVMVALCLLIATSFNYKVFVAVRRHVNIMQALQLQQVAQNVEIINTARLRKFTVGTFFVYLAVLLCYLPNICVLVILITSEKGTKTKDLQLYTLTLQFMNSSLNPLIYCWKMKHIRIAVMNILRNILQSNN